MSAERFRWESGSVSGSQAGVLGMDLCSRLLGGGACQGWGGGGMREVTKVKLKMFGLPS